MKNNKKCVIFDLDGTLLYTLEDLKNSVNFALKESGFQERSLDEIREFVGNGIKNLVKRAVPENTDDATFEKCFLSFKEHYRLHSNDTTKEYEGVTETLRCLKDNDFLLAVISNKADFAVKKLCSEFFGDLFACAFGDRDGVERKPSPDSVNEIIELLGVLRENCYYVGDSEVDVITARNANLKCIACTWGFRSRSVLEAEKPEYIIDDVKDILEIVGVNK